MNDTTTRTDKTDQAPAHNGYRTLDDLFAAATEFILGDYTARAHLAPHIVASLRSMTAVWAIARAARSAPAIYSPEAGRWLVYLGHGCFAVRRTMDRIDGRQN